VPVVLAGTRPRRLELARQWGIGRVLNVAEQPLETALAGEEFAVVIEAAGSARSIQQALSFVAPSGRVVLFGIPGEPSVPLDIARVVVRDVSLLGTTDAPVVWPHVMGLIGGGLLPLRSLVTQTYPFSRLPDAVAWQMTHPDETVKVVVES
jgi:threonine dehydrogenase-like Zn-dependent dehydrogenase